ncbi:hypothetical protein ACSBR2_014243 [Camellia fascicularis]
MSNEALCGAPQLQVSACHADSHLQSRTKQKLLIVYILLLIASILLAMTFVFTFIRCRQRRNQNPIQTDLLLAKIRHERITYHELSRATDSKSNLLGTGSFSSNYKEMFLGKMIFAAKVFKLELDGAFKSFEIECEILCNIRHRNLTKVISSCSTLDIKALVLEYMPNGTLEKWLYSHNYFLDMLQRKNIMIDVACFLMPVAHCELKPSNVLLDDDMVAHVSNFGIAKLLGVGESIAQTRTIATFGYIAPANVVPNAIVQVLDANLLRQDIEHNNARVQCVPSLMQLALNCWANSSEEGMIMKDVLVAIKKITLRYVLSCVPKPATPVCSIFSVDSQSERQQGIAEILSAKVSTIENLNQRLTQDPSYIDVFRVLFVPREKRGTQVSGQRTTGQQSSAYCQAQLLGTDVTSIKSEKPVKFSLEEIVEAAINFDETRKIGEGGRGTVYFGIIGKREVAIKKMKSSKSKEFLAELKVSDSQFKAIEFEQSSQTNFEDITV